MKCKQGFVLAFISRMELLCSQVNSFAWNAIAAFSEYCIAKLVHVVLLLYSVVSSALER